MPAASDSHLSKNSDVNGNGFKCVFYCGCLDQRCVFIINAPPVCVRVS